MVMRFYNVIQYIKVCKNPGTHLIRILRFFILVVVALLAGGMVWGQATFTWNGSLNNNWNNAGNWTKAGTSTSTFPGQNAGQTDNAVINVNPAITIANVPDITLNSLSITNRNITLTSTGTGPTTITINNTTATAYIDVTNNNRSLILGDGTAANAVNLTLQTVTTASTISGTLSIQANSTIDCSTNLVSGTGTFILSANATLKTANASGITAAAGTATGSIRTTNTRTFTAGARYIYNGAVAQVTGTGLTQNTPLSLTIDNSAGVALSAATTISGMLTMNAGTLDMANTNLTVGSLTGSGNITNSSGAAGARTITIGSDNTSPAVYSGIISNGTATSVLVTKNGTGTLTLSGANTYSGATSISAGTLSINSIANSGTGSAIGTGSTTPAISIGATGNLKYTGTGHSSNRAIILTASGGTIDASGSGTLTLSGGVTGNTFNLIVTGTGAGIESGAIATTSGTFTKNGTGTWTLSGANTFTGNKTLNAGTLNINSAQALGTNAGTFVINGGTIDNTTLGAITTANFPQTWNSDIAFTGTQNLNLGTGAVSMSAARQITVNAGTLAIGGVISGAGFRLTKAGAGALTLSGTNIFTGGTTLNSGTLNINSAQALGTVAGTFIINGGIIDNTSAGAISTVNYPQTWNSDIAFTGTQNLNLGSGVITMGADRQITVNANTLTVGGTISAAGFNLIKAGAGTIAFGAGVVTLKELNISMGTLTAPSSTLNIAGDFICSGTFTHNNGTININGAGAQSIAGVSYYNLTLANGGTKTLQAQATINRTLTLTSGILQLGNNNLYINYDVAAAITGSAFTSTNMIATDGAGYLIKNTQSAQILYPIGGGGFYSPASITVASPAAGETVNIRAVSTSSLGTGFINKYWDIYTSVNKTITATFNYDPAEGSTPISAWFKPAAGPWQSPPPSGTITTGPSSVTVSGTTSITTSSSWWSVKVPNTYYSYRSGDWNIANTWTSDPGGTTQVGNTVPGNGDAVVILAGRTVNLPSDIASTGLNVTINEGAILDMSSFRFSATITSMSGQGTLQLSTENFPAVTANTFVNAGGGTTEYKNTANFTLPVTQGTYNNLVINTSAGVFATQLSDITLNGNLTVRQGTYRINDNLSTTKLNLLIYGNVTVNAGASIAVGNGSTNTTTTPTGITGGTAPYLNYYENFHRVEIHGDFTNNGTVRFTNLTYPVYNAFPPLGSVATSGAASVYFRGNTDNTIECNNTTDFYNLIVDKGSDQTYKLTIHPSAYNYFRLFGANTSGGENGGANPGLKKALWIRTGTLVLQGLAVIPSLTEGSPTGTQDPASDFVIPSNGALVLDGSEVIVLTTADDYGEVNRAYSVSGGTGAANGVNLAVNPQGLLIYGKLQINSGYLSARESAGILYSNVGSGQIEINGGILDAKQFREYGTTGSGASYVQNNGNFFLRGRFVRPITYASMSDLTSTSGALTTRAASSTSASQGTFNINNTTNVFIMNGGFIRIYDVCGTTEPIYATDIRSSAANSNVTGGTFEILPTHAAAGDATPQLINSTALFGNLTINRGAGCTSDIQLDTYPLTVLGDLTLTSGTLLANNLNILVAGNFMVETGTTYNSGTNTTTFNGNSDQVFTLNGTLNNGAAGLQNLLINKTAGKISLAGAQTTLTAQGTFDLTKGTFEDAGKTVYVAGNITNSGNHISTPGTGKIQLNGTAAQTIGGDGNGVFQNLELNNTTAAVAAPVSCTANITINGTLTFSQDKLFNINTYNLKLNASSTIINGGANRYIQTNGGAGDGGVTKYYSATSSSFMFPIGAPTTSPVRAVKYTPASIAINGAPTAYGAVTVVPVGYEHPATKVNGFSLTYFWRVKSSGITLGPATVTHGYTYGQPDMTGITENECVAARYDAPNYAWNIGTVNDVDETNNIIGEPGSGSFLENATFIDGDYTAGDNVGQNPFGAPTKYYSRTSGLWSATTSWWSPTVGTAATSTPTANDIVIIEGNDSIYLSAEPAFPINNNDPAASFYQLNKAVVSCASLQIENGSVLDIQNNPNCNFGFVITHPGGNGKIRITTRNTTFDNPGTFVFPFGDFSDFNALGGKTEFYSINPQSGTIYILPSNASIYGTVILSPLGGSNIIFPNIPSMTILGNLITNGQDWRSWLAMTWTSNYGTIVQKTVNVKGNMHLQGGTFIYMGNGATDQSIIIDGDVTVDPGAGIDVYGSSYNNTMAIGGSLTNNSNNDLTYPLGGDAGSNVRFFVSATRKCDVIFFGSNNAFIRNTGTTPATGSTPNTIFNNVTVNKGTSQSTTLTCNIAGTLTTQPDNWLTLQNGTFRYMRTNPGTDFTISKNTPFIIPGTAGLYIDYANSGNRNVLIANCDVTPTDANDLYLNGKLTVVNGNVYVGPVNGATVRNNDIEYSGSGLSEIELDGGSLMVNGQIRRNPSMSNGILKYSQSGNSTVTINGQNAIATNAKLEILNDGSTFNMSDNATLTIVRGNGGTTFGDLYLRPETSSVTGGTIVFAHNINNSPQIYRIDANVPLNNLTITGRTAATAANAEADLMVNPLVLKGNLLLSNINSILKTNNIDVTIQGNLTNNGNAASYIYGTNLTTFNGNVQAINGTTPTGTNFYDLTVSPLASLTLGYNTTVNNDLSLDYGTLNCANFAVNVKKNLINNANYTDTQFGVILNGTSGQQQISGTGTFGRLELSNANGARILNSITMQRDLVLTAGILDISQYLLTLGQNSTIGGSPFSSSKMITSNGAYSNIGVRKYFNTGATNFTYPIGVAGKYTPALIAITANGSVGYIRVNGVNEHHPAVINPGDVLKYYWDVESSGITGLSCNLALNYNQNDVQGTRENEYVAARLIVPPGTDWSKAASGSGTDNVNEGTNTITFTFSGVSGLGGEYTAGANDAIPDNVPVYQSIADGNWTDKNIWAPVAPTVAPCPDGGPNGYIVIINNTVIANADDCFAYRTTINGNLTIDPAYSGHNLGTVNGGGTLHLENEILPAGRFADFFDCANNSILEYGGSGNYSIIADRLDNIPNLFFTGTGSRILPNKDLVICHELRINGPAVDNSVNNRKLTILGSMNLLSGNFSCGTGNGATVSFAGTAAQTLSGFTGSDALNNLEINNAAGLTFTGTNEVKGNLLLTNGVIHTTSANILNISNTSINCVNPSGGITSSFIDGPMFKRILTGESFHFPIGKSTVLGNKLSLSATQGGVSYLDWKAEFFSPNSYITYNAPLTDVNNKEYWTVSAASGSAAIVSLAWDPFSNLTPLMTQNGLPDMRVADHDGSNWNQISSTATGDNFNGTVSTSSRATIPGGGTAYYSIACINTTKPKATLSPGGPICGTAGIPVTFTTPIPALDYSLAYKYNGDAQTPVSVSSLPYTLPTDAAGGTYQLTGFTYNNGAGNGVIDPSVITTYAVPTTANAGSDIATCGVTSTTLSGNSPTVGTGLWTIVNGTGGTIAAPTSFSSSFSGVYGSSYTLRWTISNGTCTSSDDMNVNFNISPTQPATFTSSLNPVCQGQTSVTYTVPNDVNATSYNWGYTGTGATITGTGNSVSIDFSSSATSGILSVSTTNGCGTSTALTLNITVNPLPAQPDDFTASTGTVCAGTTGVTFTVPNVPAITYTWSYSGTGVTINGTLNSVTLDFDNTATGGTLGVTATNGCGSSIARAMGIIVNPRPTPALSGNQTVCTGAIEIYSTAAGQSGYTWNVTGGTISAGGTATDNTATITWTAIGSQTVGVNFTDGNGCSASSAIELPVEVFKRPVTGPAFVIPNDFSK
jgi:autotransporter-associated beta strand protein